MKAVCSCFFIVPHIRCYLMLDLACYVMHLLVRSSDIRYDTILLTKSVKENKWYDAFMFFFFFLFCLCCTFPLLFNTFSVYDYCSFFTPLFSIIFQSNVQKNWIEGKTRSNLAHYNFEVKSTVRKYVPLQIFEGLVVFIYIEQLLLYSISVFFFFFSFLLGYNIKHLDSLKSIVHS